MVEGENNLAEKETGQLTACRIHVTLALQTEEAGMPKWTKAQQAEHRLIWVGALRSGNYKQAKGKLRNKLGGFCCLGVACEISGLGRWDEDGRYITTGGSDSQELPAPVRNWLGLSDKVGGWDDTKEHSCLAQKNDRGSTFKTIANIIESEPKGLVK
jgi:hypothetical protein